MVSFQEVMSLFLAEDEDDDGGEQDNHHDDGDEEDGSAGGTSCEPEQGPAHSPTGPAHTSCSNRTGKPHVQRAACALGQGTKIFHPFELQPALVADEADAVDSLHGGGQTGQHLGVRVQFGESERGQGRQASTQRTQDGAGLCRLHVHPSQTLQTEGVFTLQHLGTAEGVVELTEADGTLQVRDLIGKRVRDDGDLSGVWWIWIGGV